MCNGAWKCCFDVEDCVIRFLIWCTCLELDIDNFCLCQAAPELSALFCRSVADGECRRLEGVCLQTQYGANKLRRLLHVLTLADNFKHWQKFYILPIVTLKILAALVFRAKELYKTKILFSMLVKLGGDTLGIG